MCPFLTKACYIAMHLHTVIYECMENNGGCEHVCKDTIDSFICACHEGYELEADLKSCRG